MLDRKENISVVSCDKMSSFGRKCKQKIRKIFYKIGRNF